MKKGGACRVEALSVSLADTRPGRASAGCSLISGAATSGGSECASAPCVAFPGSLLGMSPKKASAGRIFISGVVVSDGGEAVSASETSSSSMCILENERPTSCGRQSANQKWQCYSQNVAPDCAVTVCRRSSPSARTRGPMARNSSAGARAHSFGLLSAHT